MAIVTLGCGRNEVDSDQLAGLFHRDGAQVVDDPTGAEVVLVNTCTFIAPAKQESVDTILAACSLKEDGARAVLVVGCMAQRYPHELADAIPEADAIVGFDAYGRLTSIVEDVLAGRVTDRVIGVGHPHPGRRSAAEGNLPLLGSSPPPSGQAARPQDELDRIPPSGPRFLRRYDGRPWAYLKIASGCDRVCTFCAIPSFRGRFRSRPMDEILTEAAWLASQGARELVLVSENTTSWGKDLPGGRALQPRLLRELSAVDGIARIRLMYLQPAELIPDLIEAIAAEPTVASYFDLSLQHVAAPVIARMARSGDPDRFGRLIRRVRELDPWAAIRSNFILGFPGETEADVAALEQFLEEHVLDWVGLFPFSREDGTPSAQFPDQVPEQVTRERLQRVGDLQEQLADEAARRHVGRRIEVLVEQAAVDGGGAVGRSDREAPDTDGEIVLRAGGVPADPPVGRLVPARVVDAVGVDLVAEVDAVADGERREVVVLAGGPGGG